MKLDVTHFKPHSYLITWLVLKSILFYCLFSFKFFQQKKIKNNAVTPYKQRDYNFYIFEKYCIQIQNKRGYLQKIFILL